MSLSKGDNALELTCRGTDIVIEECNCQRDSARRASLLSLGEVVQLQALLQVITDAGVLNVKRAERRQPPVGRNVKLKVRARSTSVNRFRESHISGDLTLGVGRFESRVVSVQTNRGLL